KLLAETRLTRRLPGLRPHLGMPDRRQLLPCLVALAIAGCFHRSFVQPSHEGRFLRKLARGAAAGKVNIDKSQDLRDFLLGEKAGAPTKAAPKAQESWTHLPVLECDEGCITAIESCLEEGCSVEAMMKLDAAIAKDEKTVKAALKKKEDAFLENFLQRSGALRAQLVAMVNRKASEPWMEQLIKAAKLAFASSKGDYPKVGALPYSS
ncbi:unnamed protein product, partial [Effrenium voratum]